MNWLQGSHGMGDFGTPATSGRPDPVKPTLDSGTQGLINQDQEDAQTMGAQDYSAQTMNNVGQSSGAINNGGSSDNSQISQGGNQTDAGLSGAIKAKADKHYNNTLGKVNRQADFQGALTAVKHSTDNANTQVALTNAADNVQTQYNQVQVQAQAQKYQIISSLFSGAGSVAGVGAAGGGGGENGGYQGTEMNGTTNYSGSDYGSSGQGGNPYLNSDGSQQVNFEVS